MSQTRYCSTCGALLSQGAAICGECGARYQASPYERRATDAPGAWSQAPRARTRDLGQQDQGAAADEGVELITRESLEPKSAGATTLRSQEQYDQMMVTQPPTNPPGPGPALGMPSGPGSPGPAPAPEPTGQQMAPPLDGCTPASPLKRFLAALIDSVIELVVLVPLIVGVSLVIASGKGGTLPMILIGVGTALPLAYTLLMIWLVGAKGFTLGKLILGLRVTRMSQAGPIGFLRALGRWALYRVISLIMALSIFLDPKHHLRGFHDRVVDSVVVDAKTGRNPLQPRPDDFERAGAEHYLGASSVAVSTHENLLSEPGAAWKNGAGTGSAQPAPSSAWGDDRQGTPSPYAPSSQSGPASSAGDAPAMGGGWSSPPSAAEQPAAPQGDFAGWAPPPSGPEPQQAWGQPAPQQQWGEPASQQQFDQPAPQQQWDQPAPQQQWDEPAPQQWDQQDPQQAWGQPPAAGVPSHSADQGWASAASSNETASPGQPFVDQAPSQFDQGQPDPASYGSPAPVGPPEVQDPAQGWGPPEAVPAAENASSDLTGDAWDVDGHDVDEQTRMTAADDPLGDLEQTRISPMRLPAVPKLRLTTDEGDERVVERAVVIGRNPAAPGEEVLFVLKDTTRSVSKTHLSIDGTGDEVTVTDLGSTNGSAILREDGSRESLVPNAPTVLPAGAQVTLGDRTLSVEREK